MCLVFFALLMTSPLVRAAGLDTEPLNMVWMCPTTNKNIDITVSSSIAALALALANVTGERHFGEREINVTWLDSECTSQKSIGRLVDLVHTTRVDFILGPPCTEAMVPVADLAAYKNIPIFSWSPTSKVLDNTARFKSLLKTFPPTFSLATSLSGWFTWWQWKKIVMISTKKRMEVARSLENVFEHLDSVNLVHHYSNRDDGPKMTTEKIIAVYRSLRKEARIILFVVPKSELRKYLLVADSLNMTDGEYQFLFTQDRIPYQYKLGKDNSLWKRGDGRDVEARRAFSNLLYFTLGGSELTSFASDSLSAIHTRPWNETFAHLPRASQQPDEFSPFLHDAVILFALAYKQVKFLHFEPNGVNILNIVKDVAFKGKSGDVMMTAGKHRRPLYWMFSMDRDGQFKLVMSMGYVLNTSPTGGQVVLQKRIHRPIIWGNGQEYNGTGYLPSDTPACGFENELCPPTLPNTTPRTESILPIFAPSVIAGVLLVIGILVAFMYKKMQFERDLANMSWKIPRSALNFCIGAKTRVNVGGSLAHLHTSAASLPTHCDSLDAMSMPPSIGDGVSNPSILAAHRHVVSVAIYQNNLIAVKRLHKRKLVFDRHMQMNMKTIFELKHNNVASFVGVSVEGSDICVLWEYCKKGSILDVIENEHLRLDNMFKLSLVADICTGLEFLHSSPVKVHGRLKSSNCIIDTRWVCKLTDFGMGFLMDSPDEDENITEFVKFSQLYWTAPEILRDILEGKTAVEMTQEGDVYAYGVILKELFCRCHPYNDQDTCTPKDIIHKVAYPIHSGGELFRPSLSEVEMDANGRNTYIVELARRCWSEEPLQRPPVKNIRKILDRVNPNKKTNVVDNMIMMMEKYSNHLEDLVADRTEQLQEEKKKTDALLYRMLPRSVADDLKLGKPVQAETYEAVTIYFSDIVSFTTLASNCSPMQVVHLLNSLYTLFDDIITKYDVYKVETIGDAYMIVSGLPERNGDRHVTQMADVSLHLISGVLDFRLPHLPSEGLQIRIGLHTGPVVSGVVGLTMPRYCLFGDSVNTASRMESSGKPMRIHVSPCTYSVLSTHPEYTLLERGYIEIKGKGRMKTHWLVGKEGFEHDLPKFQHTPMVSRKSSEQLSVTSLT